MAGYIGSKTSVTQVDGYNRTEADDRYVNASGDTMTGPMVLGDGRTYFGKDGSGNHWFGVADIASEPDRLGYGFSSNGSTVTNHQFRTNGLPRLEVDSAGNVMMPYQPYIYGSLTNISGSGVANSFYTVSARGGMAFSSDRITVPVGGVYHISFNTISDNTTGRVDANILINGGVIVSMLSEDNVTGFHYKSGSITMLLAANDYIQFNNNDWYSSTNTGFVDWRTASVALLG